MQEDHQGAQPGEPMIMNLASPKKAAELRARAEEIRESITKMEKSEIIDQFIHVWLEAQVLGAVKAIYARNWMEGVSAKKKGAAVRHEENWRKRDSARELWDDWQAGRTIHKSAAAFDRFVMEEGLVADPKTSSRWRKKWEERKKGLC